MLLRRVLLIAFLAYFQVAYAAKPDSPIRIEIAPAGAVKPGSVVAFKVTASSMIPAETLAIQIHPIGNIKWNKGERRWSGAVQRGVPQLMEFSVVVPKKGGFELHAVASIQGKEGGGFGARAVYAYEDPTEKKMPPKERKSTRQGKEVIEVPVK